MIKMVLYFAYGSNLFLAQIRERVNNSKLQPLYNACLPDKKLCFPRCSKFQKGGVASYEDQKNHNLWGAVFDITENELKRIDKNEGYEENRKNNSYERTKIIVIKSDGTKIDVLTYRANPKGTFTPSQDYMDKLISGAKECNLPYNYIKELEKIQTI